MKRIVTITVLSICFLAMGSWSYAQGGKGYGRGCGKCAAGTAQGANFVDADGDGICDNAGTRQGRGRGSGKGLRGSDQGANFVDADGDRICDNAGTRKGRGQGQGKGFRGKSGNGTAQGPNYVDNDGDGVCDNFQQNQPQE
jgi:hypothetical protein